MRLGPAASNEIQQKSSVIAKIRREKKKTSEKIHILCVHRRIEIKLLFVRGFFVVFFFIAPGVMYFFSSFFFEMIASKPQVAF
jgi:hypothetical protein